MRREDHLKTRKVIMFFLLYLVSLFLNMSTMRAQSKTSNDINPDQGRMGSYRALAQLAYHAYEQGDDKTAAILARILERTWDQGEQKNSSENSFCKTHSSVCTSIDGAMDDFIKPLTGFTRTGRADEIREKATFKVYLDTLSVADAEARSNVVK